MLLIYCFHRFISQQIDFVACLKGYLKIQDYAYHIILVKAFWFDGFGNIYDVYFQQQALSSYIGSQINKVMPLGITPIALVVWFPFAYVARFNMYVSCVTALSFYGITTQVQRDWYDNISVKRSIRFEAEGVAFNYYKFKKEYYFGFEVRDVHK
jgi:hypothetical protein